MCHQQIHHCGVPVARGVFEGRRARIVARIDIGAARDQEFDHFTVPFRRRFVKRGCAGIGIARVDRRAFIEQQCDDFAIALPAGLVEGRGPGFVALVDLGAMLQQQGRHFPIAARCGQVQRRRAGTVGRIHRCAVFQQQLGDVQIIFDDRVVERRGSGFQVAGIHRGAVLDQQRGDLAVAGPGSVVEGGCAHGIARIHVRAGSQQRAHLFHVSRGDCFVQIGGLDYRRREHDNEPPAEREARLTPRIALPPRVRRQIACAPDP